MGELSDALDEFSSISKEYYEKIQEILKEEYCWKCPMRSTSKSTSCRDIDAWIRLTGAFERGIHEHLLSKEESKNNLEAVTSRYLTKVIKKHSRHLKYHKTIVLRLKEDIEPFAKKGDLLFVKENPESIKKGDLILWPEICPISTYWFSKVKLAGLIPFNILNVSRTFHKEGCRYIQTENELEIPLEFTAGKIIKIIGKDNPLYSKMFK
jgi:hypothetical protein